MSLDADDMRIHVLGIGSIGSLFAFHLRRSLPAETPISLIVRKVRAADRTADALGQVIRVEREGIGEEARGFDAEVFEVQGDMLFSMMYDRRGGTRLPHAPKDPQLGVYTPALSGRPAQRGPDRGQPTLIDSLIVTCKAPATLPALQRVLPRLHRNSTIVLLQNGMGAYEMLVDRLFPDPAKRPHFILATTTHGVWSKGSMNVVHAGMGDFAFGIVPDPLGRRDYEASLGGGGFDNLQLRDISPDPARDSEFATLHRTVRALLMLEHLHPQWDPIGALQLRLLKKLAVNCAVNPLTALMDMTNGELLGSQHAYALIRAVCGEASRVFRAQAQAEDPVVPATIAKSHLTGPNLEEETTRVIGLTAKNYSSMLQDIKAGKPTEIDFMNGYLIGLGQKHAVPTPVNMMLASLVRLKASMGRPTELPGVMRYWEPLGVWRRPPAPDRGMRQAGSRL